jgi:hypothetical protein
MPERLTSDMRELLDTLNAWGVEYLVVGAHALGVYTEPRATKDLDVWVNPTSENAVRAFSALKQFGALLHDATEHFFAEPDSFLVIGVVPNRIDILKSIPGVEFAECWVARRTLDIGGMQVHILSPEHLLAAKLAAGRPQDLVDAAKLRKAISLGKRELG